MKCERTAGIQAYSTRSGFSLLLRLFCVAVFPLAEPYCGVARIGQFSRWGREETSSFVPSEGGQGPRGGVKIPPGSRRSFGRLVGVA